MTEDRLVKIDYPVLNDPPPESWIQYKEESWLPFLTGLAVFIGLLSTTLMVWWSL